MQKQLKQNFIELPLNTFKKKHYPIPHFLFETKFQKNQKNLQEIKKLIQSQQYQYLGQVSDERNLYCCKQRANDRLVMIEIKQVGSKNNKSIYLSINLTSALKKYIRKYFMLKNWKILDKIYFQDERGQSGLVLLEYNFVETDLRNFIRRQYELDEKASNYQITNICKDIIENLCYYHLESTVILDIRPQTIMYEDGKWFILPGDNAVANKITEFGASMSKVIGFKPVSQAYLSPLMYESFVKNDISIFHNPYKSDVYSLGLIVWQLLMIRVLDPHQIKQKFEIRKQNYVENIKNKCFNVREKLKIQNNNLLMIPNSLGMMLEQLEQKRSYIIEVCLTVNFTSTLFAKIIVPYEKFFKKQVIDITLTRKKIQYPYANMEYEGETISVYDQLIKDGRGTITYSNIKVFDGQWKNNIPHGKCTCSFSQCWSYQGMMENGKFHGQGILTFNGIRIAGTKWNQNLNEDSIFSITKSPQPGYYFICPDAKISKSNMKKVQGQIKLSNTQFSSTFMTEAKSPYSQTGEILNGQKNTLYKNYLENDYKIYFDQQSNDKSKFIFNLSKVPVSQIGRIIEILLSNKLFLTNSPSQVSLYQKVSYEKYQEKVFDLIRIKITTEDQRIQNEQQLASINKKSSKSFPQSQFQSYPEKAKSFYIDLILFHGLRSVVLSYLLYYLSRAQQYVLPLLDISHCTMNDDQFRDVIQCGIKFESIDISNCPNLSDLAIRYLVQCSIISNTLRTVNLERLKLSNQALQQLKYCQWLKRLIYLNLSYCQKLTNDKIVEFLCDQRLAALEVLQIPALNITHRGLQKIVTYSSLKSLKKLNIGSCHQLTEATVAQFVKSPQLANLTIFQCSSTTMKDIFLEVLSDSQNLNSKVPLLSQLNISGSINLSVIGISKFLLSKNSKNLIRINLSNLDLNDDFVQLLAKKSLLSPNLTQLNLSACYKVTDKSIKELLKPQRLINLKILDLSKTNVSNDTLFLLSQSNSRKLKHLKVYKCSKMNDTGFEKFILSPAVSELIKLQIGGTSVRQVFFTSLASEKTNFVVQELYLNECLQINEKSFCRFLGSKKMTGIRLIDISFTRFTNNVIQALNKNPFLKFHLVHVITNNCLNPKGQQLKITSIPSFIQQNFQESRAILKQNPLELANNPLLLKMTQFQSSTDIPQIEKLFTSIYLINLTKLHLKWQQCTLSLKSLAQSKVLNSFKELSLIGSKFSQQSLIELIKSSTIKSLENLNLSWTDVTNQTLNALATSTYLFSLRNLNLSKCSSFNDKGLVRFLQSGKVTLLTILDLRSTLITNASIQALAKSKCIKSLTKLILRSCPNISQVGFKEYFASGVCSTLKQLDVAWTRVQGNLFSYIIKSKVLQLNSLKIAGLKKVQFQFVKFLQSLSCSTLLQLQLSFTQITIQSIQALIQTKYLQCIEKLELLGFDFLGNQQKINSLVRLLQSINMSKITNLKLTFSNYPQKVYIRIFDTIQKNLHVLQKLCLIGANSAVLEKAKKTFKKCEIITEQ